MITRVSRFTHVLTVDPVPSVRHDTADSPDPHDFLSTIVLSSLFTQAETPVLTAETTRIPIAEAAETAITAANRSDLDLR